MAKRIIPREVVIQACKDLYARNENAGTWIDRRIPDSWYKIREIYGFDDDDMWVMVVEGIVNREAVKLVAEQ